MKIENNIGWCDETINAVTGCDKVSAGCKNCYAEAGTRARVLRAQGIETWGPNGVRNPVNFEPVFRRLNKLCVCDNCHTAFPVERLTSDFKSCGAYPQGYGFQRCFADLRRIRLFADSNSDWLDEKWPIETLARFLDAIRQAPNVDVILLTKRPENIFKRIEILLNWIQEHDCKWPKPDGCSNLKLRNWLDSWFVLRGQPPTHIWLGVSVENQAMADKRIAELLRIPAAVHFLSCEPLLEKIDIIDHLGKIDLATYSAFNSSATTSGGVGWVIVGGESGDKRRDCGVESIVSVAEQCCEAGVTVYVKQDTAFKSGQQGRIPPKIWAMKGFPI